MAVRHGEWRGDGRTYGPLPDKGFGADDIRLVYHTTESRTIPGYNSMAFAPHWSADVARLKWVQHSEVTRRVGTMLGYSVTGINANEISVQVEIIAYSDKALAAKHGGLWVGDFTDKHYEFLAELPVILRKEMNMSLTEAYGPSKDFASFLYGKHDANEMSHKEWYAAGGILTGHGAGPHQKHWDTGALDLHRIIDMSLGGTLTTTPMADWRKLYNQAERIPPNSIVEMVQHFLTHSALDSLGPNAKVKRYYFKKIDGKRDAATHEALQAWKRDLWGNPNAGIKLGEISWNELNRQLYLVHVQEPAAPVTPTDCSAVEGELATAQAQLATAQTQLANANKALLGCNSKVTTLEGKITGAQRELA